MEEAAIIGSSTTGAEIAQVMATAGIRVRLLDSSSEVLTKAIGGIRASLDRLVKNAMISEESAGQVFNHIEPVVATNDYACLANADLVLEVVPDKIDWKEKVLTAVCAVAKSSAIIACNSPSMSITKCAGFLPAERTARFAGLHFSNPVPIMKLVKVVRGLQTNDETVEELMQLCQRLNKTGVPCIDSGEGFLCNRFLVPMINEAMFAVYEGLAAPADVDKAMMLGASQSMGTLSLADMIGLDTILSVMDVVHCEVEDSMYRACPLLREMVEAGQLGRKTGKGFFDYGKPVVATNDVSCLAHAELVLGGLPEKVDMKEKVLKAVSAAANSAEMIACNASSRCAALLPAERPARFANLHLSNPVPARKPVEVIQDLWTDGEPFKELMQMCQHIDKTGAQCIDSGEGLMCNSFLVPMINEAMFAVFEGLAAPADVDKAMMLGASQPMGPLSLADMIGLDTILSVMDALHREVEDSKYRACPLLRKMVAAGQLGRKTGKGFFDYGKQSKL